MTTLLSSIRDSFYKPKSESEADANMPSATPEKGDKVSWEWGGAAPSGTVADKITEGEASVTSKRGNTISKAGEPDDPALALERPGNDVVKKASEVEVEEKGKGKKTAGGAAAAAKKSATPKPTKGAGGKKAPTPAAETNGDADKETPAKGTKRTRAEANASAADDEDEEEPEEPSAKKNRGRPKSGLTPKKRTAAAATGGTGRPRGRPKSATGPKPAKPKVLGPDGKPRGRGRPKGTGGTAATKAKGVVKKTAAKATGGAKRGRKAKK